MLYPVYVHMGDEQHAHGVTIPDFAGCFSSADDWSELVPKIQEAVELWAEGEDVEIPKPSSLEQLLVDPQYEAGVWMLVDIDVSRLQTKPVRLNISLPQNLVHEIDQYAQSRGMTRSGFLARAAADAMRH